MQCMVPALDRTSLLLKGTLDLCVLAVIDSEPTYGYEVQTRLDARGLRVADGTVYPLLARLSRLQLLTSTSRPSPTGPPRKYYSLTPSGREALHRGTAQWRELSTAITAVLPAPAAAAPMTEGTTP